MSQSTQEKPIRNGQTVTYLYTFLDAATGAAITITGKTITYQVKFRGQTMASGSGTVSSGVGGIATASITFTLANIMDYIPRRDNPNIPVNVQFYANGDEIPGQPQVEYVAPNVDDIATASHTIVKY